MKTFFFFICNWNQDQSVVKHVAISSKIEIREQARRDLFSYANGILLIGGGEFLLFSSARTSTRSIALKALMMRYMR